ncbi:MAG: tryptophan synthase subunit alpha [Phycisphaerales bacterium]|nr:tryptophan synthase subunit alpha [Phycisphaerales bacterium]
MSRIDDIFARHRETGTRALMPFLTGGFPDLEQTRRALLGMGDAGASIVEIGFPYSDPIADGPVIASSMHEALTSGLRIQDLFETTASIRDQISIGLVAMVSESIIERYGTKHFVEQAAQSGFDGLIVPDMDLARAMDLGAIADAYNLSLTFLIAPTTSPERCRKIAEACRGFIYLLAQSGLTGERDQAPEIQRQVEMVKSCSDLPIAAGFGISNSDHVKQVTAHADAAIVGSALVRRMTEAQDPAQAALDFTRELATGLA